MEIIEKLGKIGVARWPKSRLKRVQSNAAKIWSVFDKGAYGEPQNIEPGM